MGRNATERERMFNGVRPGRRTAENHQRNGADGRADHGVAVVGQPDGLRVERKVLRALQQGVGGWVRRGRRQPGLAPGPGLRRPRAATSAPRS